VRQFGHLRPQPEATPYLPENAARSFMTERKANFLDKRSGHPAKLESTELHMAYIYFILRN